MDREWYRKTKHMSENEQWEELYRQERSKVEPGKSIWLVNDKIEKYSGWTEKNLKILFDDLKIKSVVDVGCSDVVWQSKMDWSNIDYTGIDIVKDIVKQNKKNYPHMKFQHKNLIEDECPMADMVIVRNVFLHTTLDGVKNILTNIKKSGAKYLLASTDITINKNAETCCTWATRRNLELEPFNLEYCIALIPEILPSVKKPKAPNNYLGLWYVNRIPDYDSV